MGMGVSLPILGYQALCIGNANHMACFLRYNIDYIGCREGRGGGACLKLSWGLSLSCLSCSVYW